MKGRDVPFWIAMVFEMSVILCKWRSAPVSDCFQETEVLRLAFLWREISRAQASRVGCRTLFKTFLRKQRLWPRTLVPSCPYHPRVATKSFQRRPASRHLQSRSRDDRNSVRPGEACPTYRDRGSEWLGPP